MKTVILCGGRGLRYGNRPKGLALIGNKPIVHHVIDIYARQKYNDFMLILGFKSEDIEKYFESFNHNYNIEFVHINDNMNKGGALMLAKQFIEEDNFFVNYCDCLADINLNILLCVHRNSNVFATITAVRPNHDFGIIEWSKDDDNKIACFKEKPQMNEWTNGGFFVFNKKIFNYIQTMEDELETDIFNRLVDKGQLAGYRHFGFWNTINTQKDEEYLNRLYDKSIKENSELDWYKI